MGAHLSFQTTQETIVSRVSSFGYLHPHGVFQSSLFEAVSTASASDGADTRTDFDISKPGLSSAVQSLAKTAGLAVRVPITDISDTRHSLTHSSLSPSVAVNDTFIVSAAQAVFLDGHSTCSNN